MVGYYSWVLGTTENVPKTKSSAIVFAGNNSKLVKPRLNTTGGVNMVRLDLLTDPLLYIFLRQNLFNSYFNFRHPHNGRSRKQLILSHW